MNENQLSIHRPTPTSVRLPEDPREAAAGAIAFIKGESSFNRAAGAEALSARIQLLSHPESEEALCELSAHLPVLEALFLRFAGEASASKRPEHQAALIKISLAAQAAYGRTAVLISGLRLQRMARAQVQLAVENSET